MNPAPQRDLTLVQLAAVIWDFPLVGRTRCLSEAWTALGQPNLFVQFPSPRNALERWFGPRREARAAHVVRPPWVWPPRFWRAGQRAKIEQMLRKAARRLRREMDGRLDWKSAVAIVVNPQWAPWLDELPFGRVIYDCIDDVAVHAPRPELAELYRAWEESLLDRADALVVTAEVLEADLRRRQPALPLKLIRNGVDVERFQHLAATTPRPADLPADATSAPPSRLGFGSEGAPPSRSGLGSERSGLRSAGPTHRPLIGFVGALYHWIDWPLIEAAVAALPECDFAFVGPDDGNPAIARLKQRGNVRFLGPRPYALVPAYMQAFDVCWTPFDDSAISKAANPVKVYEYLSLGKPTVTTQVAGHATFPPHAAVGRTPDEVIALLRAAVQDHDPARAAARVAFARENSWAARATEYVQWVQNTGTKGRRD